MSHVLPNRGSLLSFSEVGDKRAKEAYPTRRRRKGTTDTGLEEGQQCSVTLRNGPGTQRFLAALQLFIFSCYHCMSWPNRSGTHRRPRSSHSQGGQLHGWGIHCAETGRSMCECASVSTSPLFVSHSICVEYVFSWSELWFKQCKLSQYPLWQPNTMTFVFEFHALCLFSFQN